MIMKKRILFSALIVACVVLFLCFSNQIIANISGPHFEKWKENMEDLEKDYVMYDVNGSKVDTDPVLEQIHFSGWAFCPTKSDNSNKEIGILLSSKEESYFYLASPTINRFDLALWGIEPLPLGGLHGFGMSVSTLLVSNGIYDVYIYCKENEENYGLEQTQYSLIKRGTEIQLSEWTSGVCPMIELSDLQYDAKLSIVTNETAEDGTLKIGGWAFLPDLYSGDQRVIVCLEYEDGELSFFKTRRTRRQDVAVYFDNPLYSTSGFEARIPAEKLQEKPYDVIILLEDERGLHTCSTG